VLLMGELSCELGCPDIYKQAVLLNSLCRYIGCLSMELEFSRSLGRSGSVVSGRMITRWGVG
jgi:hypothetical protein